jgi:hypothetical protein
MQEHARDEHTPDEGNGSDVKQIFVTHGFEYNSASGTCLCFGKRKPLVPEIGATHSYTASRFDMLVP